MMVAQAPAEDRVKTRTGNLSERWGLPFVIAVGLAYGLVYSSMRLAISENLPQDDVTANILAQTLELGYVVRQPPLHEWMVWSLQRVTGPTLLSFLIIKYGLLTATFAFLYLVAKRIFTDPRWVVLGGLSPLFLYQIAWNLHEGVTQTMALIAAVAATMWAFMRIVERGGLGNYVLFGVAAGLGLLSKYTFAGYLFVLLVGALLQPAMRARVFDWRILASAATGLLLASPFLYWLIAGWHDLVALYGEAVAPKTSSRLKATAIGLGMAVFAPLGFLFPLDVILPVLFPRMIGAGRTAVREGLSPGAWKGNEANWPLLLFHITLGSFLVLILGAILTGATHILERYMHPFFLLTPLWLLWLVERSGNAERKLRVLAIVLATATLAIVPIRLRDLHHAMGPQCEKCRVGVPYEGLAAALEARGFHAGTIIAADRHDAGNLRRMFPAARIVVVGRPTYSPPVRESDRSAKGIVVWRKTNDTRLPLGAAEELAKIEASASTAPELVRVPWQPYPPRSAKRQWEWMVVVTNPAKGG